MNRAEAQRARQARLQRQKEQKERGYTPSSVYGLNDPQQVRKMIAYCEKTAAKYPDCPERAKINRQIDGLKQRLVPAE